MNNESLNLDFTKKVVINPVDIPWVASPADKVHRKQFERDSAESGRATSLVKFDAGASFKSHIHPKGEEIFVLDGIFSDENGDYPAGTYLRHPPGTHHAPFSKEGCVIFVKLDHFHEDDNQAIIVRTQDRKWQPGIGNLEVMGLHDHQGEHTALVKWPKDEHFQPHNHWGGEEILVLEGTFSDEFGDYPKGCWIRSPHLSNHNPFTNEPTLILVKVGHLPDQK
jgi:anti-sigma factor ChrR (cupin superfamily)